MGKNKKKLSEGQLWRTFIASVALIFACGSTLAQVVAIFEQYGTQAFIPSVVIRGILAIGGIAWGYMLGKDTL